MFCQHICNMQQKAHDVMFIHINQMIHRVKLSIIIKISSIFSDAKNHISCRVTQ